MAHLLNHPLHLCEYLGPKDRGVPDAGVDRWVDLIWHIMHQPQTSSHKLLLEEQHLRPLHLLLPHHLPGLHQVLKVQVRESLLMGVLAQSSGVDGVMSRVWLEGI